MSKRLIYAEDAIEALCKAGCESGYCGISCDDVKAIEQLPSAQPECKQECMPMYADVCDYISRQAAIDEAYEIIIDGQKFEVVQVETLMGLPPAQQWIPTSKTEKIPDHEVLCCDRYDNQMVGYLTNDHGEWICESDSEVMYDTIAWMEKPQSYKELEEDE